jgi:hypothetical protein
MRKPFVSSSLIALMATLFLSTAGTALATTEVSTFAGCDSLSPTPVPSHECEIGDSPGGYLKSNEQIFYDICTKHPNGESVCETNQSAAPNVLFGNVIVAKEVGQYLVTWTKTGEGSTSYGSWTFTMKAAGSSQPPESTPENRAPAPVPVVTPPIASQQSVACTVAKRHTKTLAAKLKTAGKNQKSKVRARLRKARATVASAC